MRKGKRYRYRVLHLTVATSIREFVQRRQVTTVEGPCVEASFGGALTFDINVNPINYVLTVEPINR